jgi:hypothetical protein
MTCPKCGHEQPEGFAECRACGVIFSRIHPRGEDSQMRIHEEAVPEGQTATGIVRGLFFSGKADPDPVTLGLKALLTVALLAWGFKLFFVPVEEAGNSILHYVNLPFHEAGHIFFSPLGEFLTTLGGSLFQLIMPLACAVVLLVKTRDPFGASIAFWWFGENFIDMASYINDARALELTLIGGVTGRERPGFHDWENILGTLGLLNYDHTIASAAMVLGLICMLSACSWAGYLLFREFLALRSGLTTGPAD